MSWQTHCPVRPAGHRRDFNTWRGAGEPAVAEIDGISDPAPWPAEPTFADGRVLDPSSSTAAASARDVSPRPETYGSDNFRW